MYTYYMEIYLGETMSSFWNPTKVEIPKPQEENKPSPTPITTTSPFHPNWGIIFSSADLDPDRVEEIASLLKFYYLNIKRYEEVSKGLIPPLFIFALHYRESSLSFDGCLANGQKIIGTGRVTTWVPKGLGPYNTWEESAIDILKLKGFYNESLDWRIGPTLLRAEKYNGLGYRKTGEYSPYICAGTTFHDETGKYVADGKYKRDAIEKQLGVMAFFIGQAKGLGKS